MQIVKDILRIIRRRSFALTQEEFRERFVRPAMAALKQREQEGRLTPLDREIIKACLYHSHPQGPEIIDIGAK